MTSWLPFLKAIVALITIIAARSKQSVELAAKEQMRKMGRLEAITEALSDATKTLEEATAARQQFRAERRTHPDRLHNDDGFRRDDIQPSARDPT